MSRYVKCAGFLLSKISRLQLNDRPRGTLFKERLCRRDNSSCLGQALPLGEPTDIFARSIRESVIVAMHFEKLRNRDIRHLNNMISKEEGSVDNLYV